MRNGCAMNHWPVLPDLPVGTSAGDESYAQAFVKPFVHDVGNVKSLHFTRSELQSRMNRLHPWHLEVDYTRTMMGFLLLQPAPASIGMVGLGGGSLAKFCYRELPDCSTTAVENNPHVIALRREFEVPDDDARFQVVAADGAVFVKTKVAAFDVLLIDGFDHNGQSAALCTQGFYDDCFAALKADGVLVVNLHHDDADYGLWAGRVSRSFGGNAVEVLAPEKSNSIVFASRGSLLSHRRINLQHALAGLGCDAGKQLKAEFARILWSMKDMADQ
jgi:spermidine synthase